MDGWRRAGESEAWLDKARTNVSPLLAGWDPATGALTVWDPAPELHITGQAPQTAALDVTGKYAAFTLTPAQSAAALTAGRMDMVHRGQLVYIFWPRRQT